MKQNRIMWAATGVVVALFLIAVIVFHFFIPVSKKTVDYTNFHGMDACHLIKDTTEPHWYISQGMLKLYRELPPRDPNGPPRDTCTVNISLYL